MLINQDGKLWGKFNIIDVLVLLVVLIAMLGVYFKFVSPRQRIVTETKSFEYVVRVHSVRAPTVEGLRLGGRINDSKFKDCLGIIYDVDVEQSYVEANAMDGTINLLPLPDQYTVFVTIKADGKSNSEGYYTGKNKGIRVGCELSFCTKHVLTSGEVVAVADEE